MQAKKFEAKAAETRTAAPVEAPKVDLDEMAMRSQGVLDAGRYQPANEEGLERLAERYYCSGALPDSYYPPKNGNRWDAGWRQAGISKAYIVMLFGAGLGILPSLAIWAIHVINGRPCPSADFMWARMLATGILRRDDFSIEASRTACKIVIGTRTRPAAERLVVEAKYEDFKHLHGKDNWKNHPEDMLVARAKSRACRRYAPDIFAGVYSAEEMRSGREDAAAGIYEVPEEMLPDESASPAPAAEPTQEAPAKTLPTNADVRALRDEIRAVVAPPTEEQRLQLWARVDACEGHEHHDKLVAAWMENKILTPPAVAS